MDTARTEDEKRREALKEFFDTVPAHLLDDFSYKRVSRLENEDEQSYRRRLIEMHLSIGSTVKQSENDASLLVSAEYLPPFDQELWRKHRLIRIGISVFGILQAVALIVASFWFIDYRGPAHYRILYFTVPFAALLCIAAWFNYRYVQYMDAIAEAEARKADSSEGTDTLHS